MTRIRIDYSGAMTVNSVRQILVDAHAHAHAPIALYRLSDGFFATDDCCTHGEASLAEGEIEDGEIVCPFHLGKFDIRSGAPTAAPCTRAIRTYPVIMEADGSLAIELE